MKLLTVKVNGSTVLLDEPVDLNDKALRVLSQEFQRRCAEAGIRVDMFVWYERTLRNHTSLRSRLNSIRRQYSKGEGPR